MAEEVVQKYKAIFTPFGKSVAISAYSGGERVKVKYIGIGEGNLNPQTGKYEEYTPEFGQEALLNEWHEAEVNNLFIAPDNPYWLTVEGVIPENVGGHFIREVCLKDENHNVLTVASYPETYKPLLEEGSSSAAVIRQVMEVLDTEVFELTIDTSLALVTRDEFLRFTKQMATTEIPGIVKLSKNIGFEGEEGDNNDVVTNYLLRNKFRLDGRTFLMMEGDGNVDANMRILRGSKFLIDTSDTNVFGNVSLKGNIDLQGGYNGALSGLNGNLNRNNGIPIIMDVNSLANGRVFCCDPLASSTVTDLSIAAKETTINSIRIGDIFYFGALGGVTGWEIRFAHQGISPTSFPRVTVEPLQTLALMVVGFGSDNLIYFSQIQ